LAGVDGGLAAPRAALGFCASGTQTEQDFEKGEADGTAEALTVLGAIAARLAPKLAE
jgi:hypothetical protein